MKVRITTGEYSIGDFSKLDWLNEEDKKIAQTLLPDYKKHWVEFILLASNSAMANAIRRTAMSEIPTLILYPPKHIDTNEEFIISSILRDFIMFIKLDQTCPKNITFSLDVANSSDEIMVVRSTDIKASDGGKYFIDNIALCNLQPNRYLRVDPIRVSEDIGIKKAKYSITTDFRYSTLEYAHIDWLTQKGIIVSYTVLWKDLLPHLKKKYNLQNMNRPNIILVPDSSFEELCAYNLDDYYDEVVRDKTLEIQSTLLSNPSAFKIRFILGSHIEANDFVNKIRSSLQKNFAKILEGLENYRKNDGVDTTGQIETNQMYNDALGIKINGQTYTTGELIKRYVFDMNPDISYINCEKLQNFEIYIKIVIRHPDPIGTIENAIKKIQEDLVLINM